MSGINCVVLASGCASGLTDPFRVAAESCCHIPEPMRQPPLLMLPGPHLPGPAKHLTQRRLRETAWEMSCGPGQGRLEQGLEGNVGVS